MRDAQDLLRRLAARLRSRAVWLCRDGYYTTEMESACNNAVRTTLDGIAEDIEELLLPEPDDAARG